MSVSPEKEFARLTRLPPYVFNITTELKMAARRRGEDIIDFGMGNPDQPTPPRIVEKMIETARRGDTHRYSVSKGIARLRKAICNWYLTRYGVELDPEKEAIVTIGSLDELPQVINVLRGEMSLVGPRMISPEEIMEYDRWDINLLTVRPGITGLWQVSGRSDVSYDQRVRLDMHYIRNWTIWLDIRCCCRRFRRWSISAVRINC